MEHTQSQVEIPRLQKLFRASKPMELSKGSTVQSSENAHYINFIDSGFVKRYMITNDGSKSIQVVYGPFHIFSLTFVFKELLNQDIYEGSEVYYYETMCQSKIYTLDIDVLIERIHNDPLIYKELLAVAGRRFHSNIQRIENMALKVSCKKVAHQLLYFSKQFGVPTTHGINIKVPLTHQDIAGIVGMTRETVSLCMSTLREEGLLLTNDSIVVPDLEKLEEIAYS